MFGTLVFLILVVIFILAVRQTVKNIKSGALQKQIREMNEKNQMKKQAKSKRGISEEEKKDMERQFAEQEREY